MAKRVVINIEWCKSCGYCVAQCPRGALSISEELNMAGYHHVLVDERQCIGCGVCYSVCPDYVFTIVEDGE